MAQEDKTKRPYSGKGWRFISLSGLTEAPGWFAVPITVVGFLLISFIVGALIWRACNSLISGSPDDIYKILLTLAGALGAPFVIWRTIVAHQQTVIARESYYTSLFTKAVEQLGGSREFVGLQPRTEPNLEVRLGAIYALERIAKDSERDHWSIMEVLCAYIRNAQNTGMSFSPSEQQATDGDTSWLSEIAPPRVDVQAAVNVIGRRQRNRVSHEEEVGLRLDLSGANLQRIRFVGDFRRADFGRSDLAKAAFFKAQLAGDQLENATKIDGASFTYVTAEMFDMTFVSELVEMYAFHSDFRSAVIRANIRKSSFSQCDFSGAKFSDVTFTGVKFYSSNFSEADLSRVVFESECSFYNCNFSGTNLGGANLAAVRGLTGSVLEAASGDEKTMLPPGVDRPESWMVSV